MAAKLKIEKKGGDILIVERKISHKNPGIYVKLLLAM
jgi:hypothetical protein